MVGYLVKGSSTVNEGEMQRKGMENCETNGTLSIRKHATAYYIPGP